MDLIPTYVARKHGREKTEYLHPAMEEVLRPTYGVFVYQEQVMQMSQRLAGYTLGGADLLRRAMGKKKPEEMAKQRAIFVEGAKRNDIAERIAGEIFDQMEKFAGYGFNKSHAAAYALVSYQTAWLKAHHPAEFMAAVLSCDIDHTDTVVMMLEECGNMGLKIIPPHVNRCEYLFTVSPAGEILSGLGAIRGVGEAALESVLAERAKNGPYQDLEDFCRRIDLRKANKRVLEALIMAGALDGLGANRATMIRNLPTVLAKCEKESGDADAGQVDLFGNAGGVAPKIPYVTEPEWPELELLRNEKNVLGYYLSGHPIESHRAMIDQVATGRLRNLIDQQGTLPSSGEHKFARRGPTVLVGAWLTDLRRFGKRASLTLDDRTAQILVPLNDEMITQLRTLPKPDQVLFVAGRISPDNFTGGWQIYPREIFDLDEAQRRYADRVMFRVLDAERTGAAFMKALGGLKAAQGCPVSVRYVNGKAQVMLDLGGEWRIRADSASLRPLQALLGEENVKVVYKRAVISAPEAAYAAE
jgi:DNA polymerase-3 subunit alpha